MNRLRHAQRRLWRAMFVGAVAASSFFAGAADRRHPWLDVAACCGYIANAAFFFWLLWRDTRKEKQAREMLRSLIDRKGPYG